MALPVLPESAELEPSSDHQFNDAWALFDGNTSTSLRSKTGAPVRVRIQFANEQRVDELAIFGTAQGTLTVFVDRKGLLERVDGLTGLALDRVGQRWTRFAASSAIHASSVVLEWMPTGEQGPSELMFWGLGPAPRPVFDHELSDRVLAGSLVGSVEATSPRADAELERITGPVAFPIQLDTDPRAFARAYLAYELRGLGHWTNAVRRINGGEASGGSQGAQADGGLQVEEISPGWLHRGQNSIEFLPVRAEAAASYRVKNVRIVGIPHAMAFEAVPRGGPETRRAAGQFDVDFMRDAQPQSLLIDVDPNARSHVDVLGSAGPRRSARMGFDVSGLAEGWHRFDLDEGLHESAGVSLRISHKANGGGIRNALVTASAVPVESTERLAVTYPLHGECESGQARIIGFIESTNAEPLHLSVGGKPADAAVTRGSSFEINVAEPPAQRGKAWQVRLEAAAGSNKPVSRVVALGPCIDSPRISASPDESKMDDGAPYATVVDPRHGATLTFAGARLDIPKGAVAAPTRITIRPLVGDQVRPLGRVMQNVTPEARAFRFGPHGLKFKKPIKLTMPYDAQSFAPGMSEDDVRGFYFDEDRGEWRQIGRFGMAKDGALTSLTDHFTDFVNATLAKPDSPGAKSFNPNEMKGITLGSPSAGVTLIEPPEASSTGSARLSYPLEVPPGRNGIEPSLALTYDSDVQNGWVGMGWDLRLSSIEIDTRFGVPKYDGTTDRYLLDGDQLTPLDDGTHFVRRVEGRFDRIERTFNTDNKPSDYSWIVTDKSGTRYTYGRSCNARLAADPLCDHGGGIFRWYLESVTDTFGNTMTISYLKDEWHNSETFLGIYPRTIDYTWHGSLAASYHVDFWLEGETQDGARPGTTAPKQRDDVIITGRSGFPVATRYKLGRVDVRLDANELIRSYELRYDDKADFQKSMLQAVAVRGSGTSAQPAAALYEHSFEYYKAPRDDSGNVQPFGDSKVQWGTAHRDDGGLSKTKDSTIGGSVGGGIGIGTGSGKVSLTASVGGFTGSERVHVATFDVNGDALAELIDRQQNTSFNFLRAPSDTEHLSAGTVSGLVEDSLGHTDRSGWMVSGGLSAFGDAFSAGVSYTRSTTEDDKIVSDFNGDGFPDLISVEDNLVAVRINDGRGNFGTQKSWGSLDLDQAPSGLPDFASDPSVKAAFHLVDPLLRWTAPFAGNVTIHGALEKIKAGGDGVFVEIFHNGERLWRHKIEAGDTSVCNVGANDGCGGEGIAVQNLAAGDNIYAKVDANGAEIVDDPLRVSTSFDEVVWIPSIIYDPPSGSDVFQLEPDGSNTYQYVYFNDHRLAGRPEVRWLPSSKGKLRINGNVAKLATPDGVTVAIIRHKADGSDETILSQTMSADADSIDVDHMGTNGEGLELDISPGESLTFQVTSDTPLDPGRVSWDPLITYLEYCRVDPSGNSVRCGAVTCTTDETGQINCVIENDPLPDTPLPGSLIMQSPEVFEPVHQVLPLEATKTIRATTTGSATFGGAFVKGPTDADVFVLVQGVNRLIKKYVFKANETAFTALEPVTAAVLAGEQLFFTVYSDKPYAGSVFYFPTYDGVDESLFVNNRYRDHSFEASYPPPFAYPVDPFSGGYHRWFTGYYNGSVAFDTTLLYFPKFSGSAFMSAMPSRHGLPRLDQPLWLVGDADAYIGALVQRPSRVGNGGAYGGSGAAPLVAGLRKNETYNLEFDLGAFKTVGLGINIGRSTSNLDFIDMNGDRYPDSVANDGVAFNDGVSGFSPKKTSMAMPGDRMRRTEHRSAAVAVSAKKTLINVTDSANNTRNLLATSVTVGVDYGLSATPEDLIDINGDGLPDKVEQGSGQLTVQLNLGYRFSQPIAWPSHAWQKDRVNTDGVVSDVLGVIVDNIPDTDVTTNNLRLQDTSGRTVSGGATSEITEKFGAGASVGRTYTVARQIADLVDLNGDGLPDQVMKDHTENTIHVKLNLGGKFGPEETWVVPSWNLPLDPDDDLSFLHGADVLGFRRAISYNASISAEVCFGFCVTANGFASSGSGFSQMDFEDIDGDGRIDHVVKLDGDNKVYAKINRLGPTGLLSGVNRPLGGRLTLFYAREGNEVKFASDADTRPAIDMPTNQWSLATVVINDGLGNQYTRNFRHRAGANDLRNADNPGSGFYDRVERENYGYALTTTTREDGSELESQAHNQDFYRRGLVHETIERDGLGGLFVRQQFVYREPPDGTPPFTGTFFPAEDYRTTSWYEGSTNIDQPGKSTTEHRTWDDFGNLKTLTDEADVGTQDDVIYSIDYQHDDSAYFFKASSVEARDINGALLRKRTAVYEPGTGRMQTYTQVLSGGKDPETGVPYSAKETTWSFDHDEFGNLTGVTDPLGTHTTYAYDDRTETYRNFIEDAFGYTSSSTPNYLFGSVAEVVDANHQKTNYNYDEWGRLKQVFGPNDRDFTAQPTLAFDYGLKPGEAPFPSWARTAHKDVTRTDDTDLVTVTFVDGLDRVIQTKKDLERDNGTTTEVGMSVSGRVGFDARGRIAVQGQPIFSALPDTTFIEFDFKNPTYIEYDILSRPTLVRLPDDNAPSGFANTTTFYDFGSIDGRPTFQTTVVDANGNRRLTQRNVQDSILQINEFNDIGSKKDVALTTSYTYNPVDELLSVKDAKGNVTSAKYDTLGRMVELTSPDMGTIQWSYDLAGNLGSKQTARLRALGQRISYRYTHNRLDSIEYPDGPGVQYVYGSPELAGDANDNHAGRLIAEHSEAGDKEFKYDRLGNVVEHKQTFVRVRDPQKEPYTATMTYEFDSFGRMLKMKFPGDGAEGVTYTYDRGGLVNNIVGNNTEDAKKGPPQTSYVQFVGYDEFEKRARIIYGNGVQTSYKYDEKTRRLTHINSDQRDPALVKKNLPARPFQRLFYTYDLVGNIKTLENQARFDDTLQNVFVGKTSQSFTYDKLYQLHTADGTYQDRSDERERYSLLFSYDEIGNITEKNQGSFRDVPDNSGGFVFNSPNADQIYDSIYHYGGPRPHAPTQIDEHLVNLKTNLRALTYDASGNQTGWDYAHSDIRANTWTAEDRLRDVSENGKDVTHVLYDGDGNRAVLTSYYGNFETAHLGQHYTIKNAERPTKHIYIDNQLVASKLDPSWFSGPPTLYFHDDHLGSAQYATNDLQELAQHDEFFPTGEVWESQTDGGYNGEHITRFTGKDLDPGTGLYYFGARWYHPRISQWVSPDPLLHGGLLLASRNLALYTYASNNPVNLTDPFGLQAIRETQKGTCGKGCEFPEDTILGQRPAPPVDEAPPLGLGAPPARGNVGLLSRPEFKIVDTSETWRTGFDIAMLFAPTGEAFEALLGLARLVRFRRAASAVERAAEKGVDVAGSHPLRAINPTGSATNCVNCALALDATLAGNQAVALGGKAVPLAQVPAVFGAKAFTHQFSNAAGIEALLKGAGPGSRGVVVGLRGAGQPAHAFNAVNQGGVVKFLDAQVGGSASLSGYQSFLFILK